MLLSEQIEILQPLVNWEFDSKVRETLDLDFDFKRAVANAVRAIAKTSNSFRKNILIPLCSDITDYKLDLSKYTKDDLEFVSPTNYALLIIDDENNQGVRTLTEKNIEDIDLLTDAGDRGNVLGIGITQRGKDLYIKLNTKIQTPEQGVFDYITSIAGNQIEFNLASGIGVNDVVFNLDKADIALIDRATILSGSSNPFTLDQSKTNVDGLLPWEVNDRVYINNSSQVVFLLLTFKALPLITYFDNSTSTIIPLAETDLDYVKHLACHYLYEILISRHADLANIYASKIKLGLLKTEKECLSEIRRRINTTAQPLKVRGFDLTQSRYGR